MKRLILTALAVLFSTLTLWAQSATPAPTLVSVAAHSQHHRNKRHNPRRHPRHRTGINARR